MVYAILKSLSGLELIDGEWDAKQYPPKAVYTATAEGEAAFERWLRHPVGRMREVRSDFLIKLYFAMQRDPELARELAESQAEVCRDYMHDVERELAAALRSFDRLVLKSKLSAAAATLDWLQEWLAEAS
jgi:DNA-binding PadR family transcriptional regulator